MSQIPQKPVSFERRFKSWNIYYDFKWNLPYLSLFLNLCRGSNSLNSDSVSSTAESFSFCLKRKYSLQIAKWVEFLVVYTVSFSAGNPVCKKSLKNSSKNVFQVNVERVRKNLISESLQSSQTQFWLNGRGGAFHLEAWGEIPSGKKSVATVDRNSSYKVTTKDD